MTTISRLRTRVFHDQDASTGPGLATAEYQDAHERAHADDIRRRFAQRDVTTRQIIVFGLAGGLVPCPTAITVLLVGAAAIGARKASKH